MKVIETDITLERDKLKILKAFFDDCEITLENFAKDQVLTFKRNNKMLKIRGSSTPIDGAYFLITNEKEQEYL